MSQPASRIDPVDRQSAFAPLSNGSSQGWAEVHERVQAELQTLENDVRKMVAGVQVDEGQTKGDRFCLFSYRTFSLPGSGLDPVVAGMTFSQSHAGIVIEADISGEATGDSIIAVPSRTVLGSREGVLAAAMEWARKLAVSADLVAAALNDSSRRAG